MVSELEELRAELNRKIENGVPLQQLLELSQLIDILVVKEQKLIP